MQSVSISLMTWSQMWEPVALRRSNFRDNALWTLFHGLPMQDRSYRFSGLIRSENSFSFVAVLPAASDWKARRFLVVHVWIEAMHPRPSGLPDQRSGAPAVEACLANQT